MEIMLDLDDFEKLLKMADRVESEAYLLKAKIAALCSKGFESFAKKYDPLISESLKENKEKLMLIEKIKELQQENERLVRATGAVCEKI